MCPALLTTDSSPQLKWLHNRQPVLLSCAADVDAWLRGSEAGEAGPSGATAARLLSRLVQPEATPVLAWHPVSTKLNKAGAEDGPHLAEKCEREATRHAGSVAALFAKKNAAAAAAAASQPASGGSDGAAASAPPPPHKAFAPAAAAGARTPAGDGKRKRSSGGTPPKGQRSVAALFGKPGPAA